MLGAKEVISVRFRSAYSAFQFPVHSIQTVKLSNSPQIVSHTLCQSIRRDQSTQRYSCFPESGYAGSVRIAMVFRCVAERERLRRDTILRPRRVW